MYKILGNLKNKIPRIRLCFTKVSLISEFSLNFRLNESVYVVRLSMAAGHRLTCACVFAIYSFVLVLAWLASHSLLAC